MVSNLITDPGDIMLPNGFQFNLWTKDHELSAMFFLHPKGQDECACIVRKEDIVSLNPLNTEIILCPHCGLMGMVIDNVWEPS